MNLVASFTVLLDSVGFVMTDPSFQSWQTLVTGWVLARRRTVTQIIIAADALEKKHFSSYHRFFSQAKWSRDDLGLAVFDLLQIVLPATVLLSVDDTLAKKRGLKMFGTGMHMDPLLSSRGYKVTNWAHCWVVLSVIVEFPLWPGRYFSLPILFRLYLNKKSSQKARRKHRTKPQLTIEMLKLLCKHCEYRCFHLIGDSAYGGKSVLAELPPNCDLTSRAVLNARLYDAPQPKTGAEKRGRKRKRGEKLPTPAEMLDERCRRLELAIYGRTESARVATAIARMYAVPELELRIVAVEATKGGRGREAFYSTAVDATVEQILTWYSMRWSMEVTFHDSKQHLGFEDPQGWSKQAVEQTAPTAMLLYSLIVYWYATKGHQKEQLQVLPWYTRKTTVSFADMLAQLKCLSIGHRISELGLKGPGARKTIKLLKNMAAMAA
jgi:hypothetical protein